jgi:uncharacterized membrane protein
MSERDDPKRLQENLPQPTEKKSSAEEPETGAPGGVVLPPQAETQLERLGVNPHDPNVRNAVIIGMSFAGPIPPPNMLAEYEKVVPGLATQIIEWTNAQRQHRQALERLKTEGAERRMNRGQILAGIVALGGLGIAGVVGIFGSAIVGSIIAIVAVGGPTAAVFLARNWGSTAPSKLPSASSKKDPPAT